jgi:hypothetical protein
MKSSEVVIWETPMKIFTVKVEESVGASGLECELCGVRKRSVRTCRCIDCCSVNSDGGRLLCVECANGIYQ